MTRFHILVNPISGGGAAPRLAVPLAQRLREGGAEDVRLTYSPGVSGSTELAAESAGAGEVVVAVGGDGMLSSVAGAVADAGGVLGIAPAGRGNDFARMLGVKHSLDAVAEMLLAGRTRVVDVIQTGDRVVLGSVYAGVDSVASAVVDRSRRVPGPLQYPYAAIRAIMTFDPRPFTVTVDGEVHEHRAWTVVIANSGYYGSGMHIAPSAALDDGVLDVVLLRDDGTGSRARLLKSFRQVYDGSHAGHELVTMLRGSEVTIAATGVAAYGDGERLGNLPVTARVRPGSLTVIS